MSKDIKIGSTVQLLYWKDNEVHDFVITDIFFERYLFDWKTVIKAKYYSQKSDFWFIEIYYINDFFESLLKAKEIMGNKEAEK
jgi:hypothetical protein